jgi:hypothetical protein
MAFKLLHLSFFSLFLAKLSLSYEPRNHEGNKSYNPIKRLFSTCTYVFVDFNILKLLAFFIVFYSGSFDKYKGSFT